VSHHHKNSWPTALTAVAVGLAALTLTATTSVAAEPSSAQHHPTATRPTIVLVHGAWADGSSWASVAKRLQDKGYTVDVVPNPLRGVKSDSDYLRDYLASVKGPIVLAGHSYAGMIITQAATGNTNVKALVYVDAYIPQTGDAIGALSGPDSALAVDPKTVFDFVGATDGSGTVDLYIKQALFPGIFAKGVPKRKAAVLAAGQRPLTLAALSEGSTGTPAWKTIPSWDVVGTADRVIPPAQQEFMAHRANARVTKVDAPHLSMVSDPRAVTRVIVSAATHR
jgi:pimeloyl-ACP methyl ester carboxylesterase